MARKNDKNYKPTREEKIAAKIAQNKTDILEAHETHGVNITEVCKAVGITRPTYYRYREEDPEFNSACEEACEAILDEAEQTLVDLMRNSNDKVRHDSAKTILTARAKKRGYGTERREQTHSGSVDLNAKVEKVRFELPDNRTDAGTEPPKPASWEAATSGGESS